MTETLSTTGDPNVPLIRFRNVGKSFGGARALHDISFDIRPGVVHGLIGANGAGKSTLIRCLAGVVQPDSGSIEIDGEPLDISDPRVASTLGLAFIHQEMSLIPGWDVLRNMSIGIPLITRAGIIDWRPMRAKATAVAKQLGFAFTLSKQVDDLSTADKWLVLIGRALMADARVIAMDEPTASLSSREAERLHAIIRDLVARGTTVIFVSHRLDEVSDLCTDITVMRDGNVTRRVVGERLRKSELVTAIVGKDLEIPEHGHDPTEHGPEVLRLVGVGDGRMVRDVSLVVHEGEIVGLGGLVGSGRSELVKAVYGASRLTSGRASLNGRSIAFSHPAQAVAAGFGLVPEERRAEGLFLDESINFNINLARLESLVFSRFLPFLRLKLARLRAQNAADQVTVKAKNVDELAGTLSGGNQQKVAIARWLLDPPRVLILDEPSRGVDVGARAEVHEVIRALASRGTAVLVVSSDNEELVALCDTVVVMAEGRVVGHLSGTSITVDHLVHLSFENQREEGNAA
ncbi:sugar ABC transporter ATP-binding protein [Cryobacterium sp. TMT2-23]|uniref:sugar ABC transporter ATP-binding protein n=1 Tax=Cryobacterium sp. TMT2-23 TaxID=1259252 RepID=UPI0018E0ADEE|nr:sugar ABC transporter ATP-binding protein [Cryobacterium sp. TMT2-23]